MERLKGFLHEQLHMDRCGGRSVVRDEGTLILYDLPLWTDRFAAGLRARFPEVEVSVASHQHSLSGFIVIVHLKPGGRVGGWAAAFVLSVVGVAYSAFWWMGALGGWSTI